MIRISISYLALLICILFIGCSNNKSNPPEFLIGEFEDDYGIEYELNHELFFQKPSIKFHIVEWDIEEQFFLAKNDSSNSYDANLYSKIDWMKLNNMKPFVWGFCLSVYNAPSIDSARIVNIADRSNPKTGCNGYPFSRMKPTNP